MTVDPFFEPGPEEDVGPLWVPPPPGERPALEPVEFTQRRECHFKRKPEGKRGCARCGKPKGDLCHLGAPGSFNAFGSGANIHVWQGLKKQWMGVFRAGLEAAGLPKGLGRVLAEGQVCFGTRQKRDQGNFRIVIEKALGDTLKEYGWLEDDDWERYEFGGLALEYVPGENWTRIMVFPSWPEEDGGAPEQAALL